MSLVLAIKILIIFKRFLQNYEDYSHFQKPSFSDADRYQILSKDNYFIPRRRMTELQKSSLCAAETFIFHRKWNDIICAMNCSFQCKKKTE